MCDSIRTLALLLTLVGGAVAATALYANEDHPAGSTNRDDGGMMRGDRGAMMGRGMSRMMGHCGDMMQERFGTNRPNEQWRGRSPNSDD